MTVLRIVQVALFWYVGLIAIQLASSLVARARGRRLLDFEAAPVISLVLLAFELIRRFWSSTLSLMVLGGAACAYCIVVLAWRAARGVIWSAGETNLVAFACFCAAGACLAVPAAAMTLMVIAGIVATIATALVVRLAYGSSVPAR